MVKLGATAKEDIQSARKKTGFNQRSASSSRAIRSHFQPLKSHHPPPLTPSPRRAKSSNVPNRFDRSPLKPITSIPHVTPKPPPNPPGVHDQFSRKNIPFARRQLVAPTPSPPRAEKPGRAEVFRALGAIKSSADLDIDKSEGLALRRGDLCSLQGVAYRCRPRMPDFGDVPCIVRLHECADRRTYDEVHHELQMFERFAAHPSFIPLYSFWSEDPAHPFAFRSIVTLEGETPRGDLADEIQRREQDGLYSRVQRAQTVLTRIALPKGDKAASPSAKEYRRAKSDLQTQRSVNKIRHFLALHEQDALYLAAMLLKGLMVMHSMEVAHCAVNTRNIFHTDDGLYTLGLPGATELVNTLRVRPILSKLFVGDHIGPDLAAWAPEVWNAFRTRGADTQLLLEPSIDLWALGVILFTYTTGAAPFEATVGEQEFQAAIHSHSVDFKKLSGFPVLGRLITALLHKEPAERLSAAAGLKLCRAPFGRIIASAARVLIARKRLAAREQAALVIQAQCKRLLTCNRRGEFEQDKRDWAVVKLQAVARGVAVRRRTWRVAHAREVICRFCSRCIALRRFAEKAAAATTLQSWARMLHAQMFLAAALPAKARLQEKLPRVEATIVDYQRDGAFLRRIYNDFHTEVPISLLCLSSIEHWDIQRAQRHTPLFPGLRALNAEVLELRKKLADKEREGDELRARLQLSFRDEAALQERLGDRYEEFSETSQTLARRIEFLKVLDARSGPLRFAAERIRGSTMPLANGASAGPECVLRDDADVFRCIEPTFEISFPGLAPRYVAYVEVHAVNETPTEIEVLSCNARGVYTPVRLRTLTPPGAEAQRLRFSCLTGASHRLRITFHRNQMGGRIVSVRHLALHGTPVEPHEQDFLAEN